MPAYACQSCAALDAIVFCPVDAARLCLPCDAAVHGATTLAGLHPRAPLCDGCGAAPAALRCDIVVLCSGCADRRRHAAGGTSIEYYTGCPGPTELVRLLSVEAPQSQEDFDAWLAEMLMHQSDLLPCGNNNNGSGSSNGGACDVAIAAANMLGADQHDEWGTSSTPDSSLLQRSYTEHLLLYHTNNGGLFPPFCSNGSEQPIPLPATTTDNSQDPTTSTATASTLINNREEGEQDAACLLPIPASSTRCYNAFNFFQWGQRKNRSARKLVTTL